jgi:hypothetical protein
MNGYREICPDILSKKPFFINRVIVQIYDTGEIP